MKQYRNWALWIKISVPLIAILMFYWQDFVLLFNEAINNDITTHILSIPIILIVILYRIRHRVLASMMVQLSSNDDSLPIKYLTGILLCLLAYIIKLYGSYTFQPLEYHIISLPIFISGILLLLFNYQTLKVLAFPILFTLFLIPPPMVLAQQVGADLSVLSSKASYNILKILGLPVSLAFGYGTPIIYLRQTSGTLMPFAIDLACSGLYSLIGFLVFITFVAYIARGKLDRKIVVFLIGFPLIYSLNIFRITLIVFVGHFFGPDLALDLIHIFGGWVLIFLGVILLLQIAEKFLKIDLFKSKTNGPCYSHTSFDGIVCSDCGLVLKTPDPRISKPDLLNILFIAIFTLSLISIQIPVFTLTEAGAEVIIPSPTGDVSHTNMLPTIEGFETQFVYRDTEFEEISGQDASIMFVYEPIDLNQDLVWVAIEIGSTKYVLHPWEVCLITYPQEQGRSVRYNQLDLWDVHLLENPPISARYFVNKEKLTNTTQVILYWYTKSVFKVGEEYTQKWTKISVIKYADEEADFPQVESDILPIAISIANHWQPISKWSWIALTIAEKGILLITLTSTFLCTIVIYHVNKRMVKIKRAKNAYSKITDPIDRHLIDSIQYIKDDVITESKIAKIYRKVTGNEISLEKIREKLSEVEKSSIIDKKFMHIDDEPHITWRLNLKFWNF